jgi:hypothetical protein
VQVEEDDEGPLPAKNSALTEEYPPLKPPPPARESTGRAGPGQHKLPPARESPGQDQEEQGLEKKKDYCCNENGKKQ